MPVQQLGQSNNFVGQLLAGRTAARAQRETNQAQSAIADKKLGLAEQQLTQDKELAEQKMTQAGEQHSQSLSLEKHRIDEETSQAEAGRASRERMDELARASNERMEANRITADTDRAELVHKHALAEQANSQQLTLEMADYEYDMGEKTRLRSQVDILEGAKLALMTTRDEEALNNQLLILENQGHKLQEEIDIFSGQGAEAGRSVVVAEGAKLYSSDPAYGLYNALNSPVLSRIDIEGRTKYPVTAEQWAVAFDGAKMSPQEGVWLEQALVAMNEELLALPIGKEEGETKAEVRARAVRQVQATLVGLRASGGKMLSDYRASADMADEMLILREENLNNHEIEQYMEARQKQLQAELDARNNPPEPESE